MLALCVCVHGLCLHTSFRCMWFGHSNVYMPTHTCPHIHLCDCLVVYYCIYMCISLVCTVSDSVMFLSRVHIYKFRN